MGEPLAPQEPISSQSNEQMISEPVVSHEVNPSLQSLLVEEIISESQDEVHQAQDFSTSELQPEQDLNLSDLDSPQPNNEMGGSFQEANAQFSEAPSLAGETTEKAPQISVNLFENNSGMMDLNSINEFANSPDISLPLKYDLVISGVDTESEVELLREALTDQRLGLDREAILEAMTNGRARIHDLNPVKAAILFQRLRFDPFNIEVIEKKI